MKTYSAKPTEVTRKWYAVDASEAPVGRMATKIATLLTGKGKPMFTHHIDCGDFVVVTNTDSTVFTGLKEDDKKYYRHSGYPGGIKDRTVKEQRARDSTKLIEKAVYGMLPVNKLRPERMKRLKLYAGADHNHAAQKPETLSFKKESK
ncbi:MAG: large subunit ribosomal protein L13 [Candidatus Saccharimonadales bacterium]|jgi:large subunit ribosomal protein L13